ncbi:MAG TPA: hypothetical protein VFW71_06060 [Actinomycetota bacterium]|nr:hypothetical protein [Actinomycetota bacterium]
MAVTDWNSNQGATTGWTLAWEVATRALEDSVGDGEEHAAASESPGHPACRARVWLLARRRVVVADRLHAHILATLLGCPR